MKTKAKHTPTPWKVEEEKISVGKGRLISIKGANGFSLAVVGVEDYPLMEQDAAFIVRAVNSHDELLALAKRAIDSFWGDYGPEDREAFCKNHPSHWVTRASETIHTAEGGKP